MLFSQGYRTITDATETLFKEKGSKFFAFAIPVKSEDDFKHALQEIKDKYPDATHHCYALVMHPDKSFQKSSDDGEPSNTAGKPILRAIISNDITNIAVIVVRYFGGTMLGVPGLISAYNKSALEALKKATIQDIEIEDLYRLECSFIHESDAHRFIKKLEAKVTASSYEENLILEFLLTRAKFDRIKTLQGDFYFLKITPL